MLARGRFRQRCILLVCDIFLSSCLRTFLRGSLSISRLWFERVFFEVHFLEFAMPFLVGINKFIVVGLGEKPGPSANRV